MTISRIRASLQSTYRRGGRRRGVSVFATVALLALASTSGHTEPKEVMDAAGPLADGRTPKSISIAAGDGNVASQTGSFGYSFPIAVPPGRKGAAPSLALSYSSDAAMTGGIAAGWALSIPAIERDWSDGAEFTTTEGEVVVPKRWRSGLASGRELIEVNEPTPSATLAFRAQSDTSYARYQFYSTNPHPYWRVLLPDGSRRYFGETVFMGGFGESEEDWFPLTRSIDAYGNEVRYHWRRVDIDTEEFNKPNMGVHSFWDLDLIEYSINDAAGIVSHAEVRFEYDDQVPTCTHGAITVGASQSVRSGAPRVHGYYPLRKIRTMVREAGRDSPFRDVTHYDLTYSASEADCTDTSKGPLRVLESIDTTGFTAAGDATHAPPVTFAYGGQATLGPPTAVVGTSEVLARGERDVEFPFKSSNTKTALMDIDGDGLVDHAKSVVLPGSRCGLSWRKNLGRNSDGQLTFAPPTTTRLPTIPWQSSGDAGLGAPQGNEFCSLSGQFSLKFVESDVFDEPPPAYAGMYLVYDFRDMSRDGIADLATGLYALKGASIGNYDPDIGNCPMPQVVFDCPEQSDDCPDVPTEGYLREPVGEKNCYRWKIWRNTADADGARAFAFHTNIEAPFPVRSEAVNVEVEAGFPLSQGLDQLIDFTGDGYPDFLKITVTEPPYSDIKPKLIKWFLFRFDGDALHGQLLHVPESDGLRQYLSISSTVRYETTPDYDIYQTGLLLDVNGDGLPDLLQRNSDDLRWDIRYNAGNRFLEAIDISILASEFPPAITWTRVARPNRAAKTGVRTQHRRLQTLPGERLAAPVSAISGNLINLGNGAFRQRELIADEDSSEVATIELTEWFTTRNAIDLNGDGLVDEILEQENGAPTVRFREPTAPRGRLTQIDNGRGLATAVTYEAAADSNAVTMDGAELPSAKWVVTAITSTHAHGGTPPSTVQYLYEKPVRTESDRGLLSFRGFEKATTIAPSGAVTETLYDYETDYSGRAKATITRKATGQNPTSISDTSTTKHHLNLSAAEQPYVFVGRTDAYTCEYLSGGASATLDEAACRASINPKTTVSQIDLVGSGFALHAKYSISGERTTPTTIDGFHTHDSVRYLYSESDYLIARIESKKFAGISTANGAGVWSIGERLAGVAAMEYDSTLRYLLRQCTARDQSEVAAIAQLGACTAYSYDTGTGLVTHTQKPQQYFDDVSGGASPLTSFVSEVKHENVAGQDPFGAFKLFPLISINELGHTVVQTFDLGTGVALTTEGPNVDEKSGVEIDGFGRTTFTWVSVGDSASDLRATSVTEYNDLSSPQRVTNKAARWLAQGPYNNDNWSEVRTDFDGAGRPIAETEWNIDANAAIATTSYAYDAAGNLTVLTAPDPSVASGTASVDFVREYDVLGRVTCVTLPNGSGTKSSYGGLSVTAREFGSGGSCANPTSQSSEPTSMKATSSDVLGRVRKLEEVLDIADTSDVATTTYSYDDNNNVAQIVRWKGAQPAPSDDVTTTMVHDWVGNRLSIDRHSRRWSYTYDRNGNARTHTSPMPRGADALDYTSSSFYDSLDRLTASYSAKADLEDPEIDDFNQGATTFVYDQGTPSDQTIGRLTSMSEPNNLRVTSYRYDALGNTREVENDVDLNPIGVAHTESYIERFPIRAVSGKAMVVDHASGVRTIAAFRRRDDSPYTVRTVTADTGAIENMFTIVRNPAGTPRLTQHQARGADGELHFGRVVNYATDSVGRTTSVTSNDPLPSRISQTFGHTGTHEITSMTSSIGTLVAPRSFEFRYDDRHQLTSAWDDQGFSAAYAFSRQGLLASATVAAAPAPGAMTYPRDVEYVYADPGDAAGHRDPEMLESLVDQDGDDYASYDYDVAGNMTQRAMGKSVVAMRYDGDNRLRRRGAPSGDIEDYHYSGPNRWLSIKRSATGAGLVRIWIGESEFVYDCSAGTCSEQRTLTTVRMGGRTVLRIEQDASDARESKVIHENGLGHLLGVYAIDTASDPLEYDLEVAFQYGPFGEILEAGTAAGASANDYLQRFNGKELDTESGLSYYGYRYYDPVSLMWNRSDPKYRFAPDFASGDPRRGNLYTFTGNNSLRFVDPDGLERKLTAAEQKILRRALTRSSPAGFVAGAVYDDLVETGEAIGNTAGAIATGNGRDAARHGVPLVASAIVGKYGGKFVGWAIKKGAFRGLGAIASRATQQASRAKKKKLRGTNRKPGEKAKVTDRGTFRKETSEDAWKNAADGPNGGKLCPTGGPTCAEEVFVKPGTGPLDWDRSHSPSWTMREFPNHVERADVLDEYQRGVFLECSSCNRRRGNNDGTPL